MAAKLQRIAIRVGGVDESGAGFYPGLPPCGPFDLELSLRDDEALRSAATNAVEPYLESWRQESGIPREAFAFTLAIGDATRLAELGQGFVLQADGRARATFDIASEPFGDLVRAYEQQLISADPRRVRVLLRPPSAGVGGATWGAFGDGLAWFWQWWPQIGAAYGSYAAIREIVTRFRRATDVLVRHQRQLERHGFAPTDPVRLAAAKRWKVSELAEALGVEKSEAAAILEAFGFVRFDDATWRPPGDLPHELAMIFLSALTSYDALQRDTDALADRFQTELDAYVARSAEHR